LKSVVARLQINYEQQLARAAFDYLETGLSVFYAPREETPFGSPQVALANLAISVELMLKAFISSRNLVLLFKGLSLEIRLFLTCPESLPSTFRWQASEIELKNATDKTIDFAECTSIFLAIHPEHKPTLKAQFDFLTAARNTSVHSFLPPVQAYEVERAAYIALTVYGILKTSKMMSFLGYERNDENDQQFFASFEAARVKVVQDQLRTAADNAKKLKDRLKLGVDTLPGRDRIEYWMKHIGECPVCSSDVMLEGFTDFVKEDASEDGPEIEYLGFYPEHLHCSACGLLLNDYEELKLAAANHLYARDEGIEEYTTAMKRFEENESSG
jgi:hypothetical protein